MNIERPFKIDFKKEHSKAEFSMQIKKYSGEELVDIDIAPTLVVINSKNIGSKPFSSIDEKMFTAEVFKNFNQMT